MVTRSLPYHVTIVKQLHSIVRNLDLDVWVTNAGCVLSICGQGRNESPRGPCWTLR